MALCKENPAEFPALLTAKTISKNEYTQMAQDFCSFSRRKKGRIASYVTLFTTLKMDKKTSKLGIFFAGNRLNPSFPKGGLNAYDLTLYHQKH